MQDTHFVYTQLPFLSRLQRPITLHKKQAVLEGLGDHALVKPVVLLPFHREKGKEEKQLSANKDHIHRSIQPFSAKTCIQTQVLHQATRLPFEVTSLISVCLATQGEKGRRWPFQQGICVLSISWTRC